jgi:hypothetical protein
MNHLYCIVFDYNNIIYDYCWVVKNEYVG